MDQGGGQGKASDHCEERRERHRRLCPEPRQRDRGQDDRVGAQANRERNAEAAAEGFRLDLRQGRRENRQPLQRQGRRRALRAADVRRGLAHSAREGQDGQGGARSDRHGRLAGRLPLREEQQPRPPRVSAGLRQGGQERRILRDERPRLACEQRRPRHGARRGQLAVRERMALPRRLWIRRRQVEGPRREGSQHGVPAAGHPERAPLLRGRVRLRRGLVHQQRRDGRARRPRKGDEELPQVRQVRHEVQDLRRNDHARRRRLVREVLEALHRAEGHVGARQG